MSNLPLVLLPGTLCDERIWERVIPHLSNTCEVITPRFTCGDNMVDAVALLRKKLPERFALAGFSLGGLAALELVRQAPESVDRLALISSHAQADTPENSEARLEQLKMAKLKGIDTLVNEQFIPAGLTKHSPGLLSNEKLLREMASGMDTSDFERQTRMAITRFDQHDTLRTFTRPTLILASDKDAMCVPDKPLAALKAMPSAKLVWIEGAGHYITLEQPKMIAQHIQQWLEEKV